MPTKKSSKKTTKKDANSEVANFLDKQKKFQNSLGQKWKNRLSPQILGQRIVRVRYMTKTEAEDFGWYKRPLMMMLDNGTWLIPQQDDEGNDGGALRLFNPNAELEEELAPVITTDDD